MAASPKLGGVQMIWTTALPDWEGRIVSGRSLIPLEPLFPEEAAAALQVFKGLRIVNAPGSPTMGEACLPWVFDWVAAIFGAYDPTIGRRLINDFFLLISKKNSKSTIAAGVMVTALVRNWRMSAEFLILAPTIEVAGNSAGPAVDMVTADPELLEILKPVPHLRTIGHRTTGASLRIIAADADTVGGKAAAGVLIDELWLFGKKPRAEDMIREATGGLASRPEGFVISLSTQGDEPPAGVFKSELARFRSIREGKLTAPRSLGVMYEFPEAMIESNAYEQEENWGMTNPNLGKSVDLEFLRDQYSKAQIAGPSSLRGFFSKHLNVEIGLRLRSDRWVGAEFWEARGDQTLTLEELLARCEVVVVGADGGGLDDLLGLAVIGRERVTGRWLSWSHAWAHKIVLERRKQEASKLLDFEREGSLTIVDLPGQDVQDVADIVCQIEESGLLAEKAAIGVDPVGIGDIVDELTSDARGIALERIVGVSQGWKLSGAIKTTGRKLAGGELIHGGLALMAWAVGNAKVEMRGNAESISKATAGNAKIDPLVALFNAVSLMATNPAAKGTGPQVHVW